MGTNEDWGELGTPRRDHYLLIYDPNIERQTLIRSERGIVGKTLCSNQSSCINLFFACMPQHGRRPSESYMLCTINTKLLVLCTCVGGPKGRNQGAYAGSSKIARTEENQGSALIEFRYTYSQSHTGTSNISTESHQRGGFSRTAAWIFGTAAFAASAWMSCTQSKMSVRAEGKQTGELRSAPVSLHSPSASRPPTQPSHCSNQSL